MDFVTGLSISTNWKGNSYNSILVIIDCLTKMVHYEPVQITINALGVAEIIMDVIVGYYGLFDLIVSNRDSIFITKFWSSLYYFLGVKQKLSIVFQPQTDSQIERKNSTIEVCLQVFVNFEQNDWVKLFLIAEFAFNNAKNNNTGYTSFELNCGYYSCVSYKKNVDPCSKSKLADNLANDLRELMAVYQENFQHTQNLQKRANDKDTTLRSYAPSNIVWLNSKYIKTKQNWKLEAKFFGPF